jgi:hypothetical protein
VPQLSAGPLGSTHMKIVVIIIRVIAIIYGSFYSMIGIGAFFGIGNPEGMQSLPVMILDLCFPIFYGCLALPYRKISSPRTRLIILILLCIQALWVIYLAIHNSIAYFGTEDGCIMTIALLCSILLVLANLWAYTIITHPKQYVVESAA